MQSCNPPQCGHFVGDRGYFLPRFRRHHNSSKEQGWEVYKLHSRRVHSITSLLQDPSQVTFHRPPLLDRFRQAVGHQRTALAPLLVNRRRRPSGGDQVVGLPGRLLSLSPQGLVEDDVEAVPGLTIEERSRGDRNGEHLLQADRLGAELDLVAVVRLGLPPLVLDGERLPGAVGLAVEFDNIGLSDQPQAERPERHPVVNPDMAPGFPAFVMHMLVHDPAFGGAPALGPYLLNVDERALALTEHHVLQGGKLNEIFRVVHIVTCYLIYYLYSSVVT